MIRDKRAKIGQDFAFSVLESTTLVALVTNISYANSCISLHNLQNWSEQVDGPLFMPGTLCPQLIKGLAYGENWYCIKMQSIAEKTWKTLAYYLQAKGIT